MSDLRKIQLITPKTGAVMWEALEPWIGTLMREVLARTDARNPNNDFASGLVANNDGSVTLGTSAYPDGRVAAIPTLVSRIGDTGRAADQRFLPFVNAGNRASVQTTDPLTSTGSASTAQINIAAHVLQFGYGTVSYGSGVVSGLTPLVKYYVYADDETYAGGAVSYAASTSRPTAIAGNGRYLVGEITTANTTPAGTITGASKANPGVLTVIAHGFTTGNTVAITAVVGMTELNGNTYTITVIDPDSFSIGVDTSGFTNYVSGGTATRVSTPTLGNGSGGGWPYIP